jgi:predicted ABC-type ATPase
LTDAEWTDHVADVRLKLEAADELATDRQFTTDPDREQWSSERNRLHGDLVTDFYQCAESVPQDRKAIIIGGLGGAGKSTILEKHAGIDLSEYVMVNPDKVKEKMAARDLIPGVEGLSPMEASDLVHEESSVVAKQLAHRATRDGKNLIWDITMSSRETTDQRIEDLRDAGYSIRGIFVDIPVELSVSRADSRHREGEEYYRAGEGLGGRYVPSEVIRMQFDEDWQSRNRKTFEEVKSSFDGWSRYDNSVDHRPPALVETSAAAAERTKENR